MTDRECLDFYRGVQWPAKVADQRRATGRPILTVNWLSMQIQELMVERERQTGRTLTGRERHKLIVESVRAGADAQRMYNYHLSLEVEARACGLRPSFIMAASQPGPECEAITIERPRASLFAPVADLSQQYREGTLSTMPDYQFEWPKP